MKIALFGATGRVGRMVLQQALDQGHSVRVLARNPSAVSDRRVVIIQGDVRDQAAVNRTIRGTEVVISALGRSRHAPKALLEDAAENMVRAARANHVHRMLIVTNTSIRDPHDRATILDNLFRFGLKLGRPDVVADSIACADVIQHSGLDWTIARAPLLTSGEQISNYQVGYVGDHSGTHLSRVAMADFLLHEARARNWVHQKPVVSY